MYRVVHETTRDSIFRTTITFHRCQIEVELELNVAVTLLQPSVYHIELYLSAADVTLFADFANCFRHKGGFEYMIGD